MATNIDIELWGEAAMILIYSWNGSFEFQVAHGFFDKYVDHFKEIKKNSTED